MESIYYLNNYYRKHGEGKLFLTNGEVFIGTFLNNLINGKGRFELNN